MDPLQTAYRSGDASGSWEEVDIGRKRKHSRQGKPVQSSHWVGGSTKGRTPRILLESKRGTRIDELRKCGECGLPRHPVFRYAKSNVGPVFLCLQCKGEVMEHSLKHVTAWIETNLKRPGNLD